MTFGVNTVIIISLIPIFTDEITDSEKLGNLPKATQLGKGWDQFCCLDLDVS